MKRKKLEIGVLVIGALVIIGSLLVKFIFDLPPDQTLVISNIVFSLGFLIYIIYSIMTTNSLNREIRRLESVIDGLKKELTNKDKMLQERQENIDKLEGEKKELEQNIQEAESKVKSLEKQVSELRESQNEARH